MLIRASSAASFHQVGVSRRVDGGPLVQLASGVTITGAPYATVAEPYTSYHAVRPPDGPPNVRLAGLNAEGDVVAWDPRHDGVGYDARIEVTTASVTHLLPVGERNPPSPTTGGLFRIHLYANDASMCDMDQDGLGCALEHALGTCDSTLSEGECAGRTNPAAFVDTDGDSIPDGWETLGTIRAGAPVELPRWGADARYLDVFVQVSPSVLVRDEPPPDDPPPPPEEVPLLNAAGQPYQICSRPQPRHYCNPYVAHPFAVPSGATSADELSQRERTDTFAKAARSIFAEREVGSAWNVHHDPRVRIHLDLGITPNRLEDRSLYGDWSFVDDGGTMWGSRREGTYRLVAELVEQEATAEAGFNVNTDQSGRFRRIARDQLIHPSRRGIIRMAWTGARQYSGQASWGSDRMDWGFAPGVGLDEDGWPSLGESGFPSFGDPRTFVHELGHVLGLRHWGDPDTGNDLNCIAPYTSIMNYAYQSSIASFFEPQPDVAMTPLSSHGVQRRRPFGPQSAPLSSTYLAHLMGAPARFGIRTVLWPWGDDFDVVDWQFTRRLGQPIATTSGNVRAGLRFREGIGGCGSGGGFSEAKQERLLDFERDGSSFLLPPAMAVAEGNRVYVAMPLRWGGFYTFVFVVRSHAMSLPHGGCTSADGQRLAASNVECFEWDDVGVAILEGDVRRVVLGAWNDQLVMVYTTDAGYLLTTSADLTPAGHTTWSASLQLASGVVPGWQPAMAVLPPGDGGGRRPDDSLLVLVQRSATGRIGRQVAFLLSGNVVWSFLTNARDEHDSNLEANIGAGIDTWYPFPGQLHERNTVCGVFSSTDRTHRRIRCMEPDSFRWRVVDDDPLREYWNLWENGSEERDGQYGAPTLAIHRLRESTGLAYGESFRSQFWIGDTTRPTPNRQFGTARIRVTQEIDSSRRLGTDSPQGVPNRPWVLMGHAEAGAHASRFRRAFAADFGPDPASPMSAPRWELLAHSSSTSLRGLGLVQAPGSSQQDVFFLPFADGTFDQPIALVSDYDAIQRYACFASPDGVLDPTPTGLPPGFPYEWCPAIPSCCHFRSP